MSVIQYNDIALDANGDLRFTSTNDLCLVNGIYYVAQAIKISIQWFLGEWYLNTTIGVPWFQKILIKNPNKLDVINYIKQAILLTNGVQSLESFNLEFVPNQPRSISVSFVAITDYGRLTSDEIYTVI